MKVKGKKKESARGGGQTCSRPASGTEAVGPVEIHEAAGHGDGGDLGGIGDKGEGEPAVHKAVLVAEVVVYEGGGLGRRPAAPSHVEGEGLGHGLGAVDPLLGEALRCADGRGGRKGRGEVLVLPGPQGE